MLSCDERVEPAFKIMSAASNSWVKRLHSSTVSPPAASDGTLQSSGFTKRRRTDAVCGMDITDNTARISPGSAIVQAHANCVQPQANNAAPAPINSGLSQPQPPLAQSKLIPMTSFWGEVKPTVDFGPQSSQRQEQKQTPTEGASDVPMEFTDDDAGDAQYVDYYMAKYNI